MNIKLHALWIRLRVLEFRLETCLLNEEKEYILCSLNDVESAMPGFWKSAAIADRLSPMNQFRKYSGFRRVALTQDFFISENMSIQAGVLKIIEN